MKKCLSLATIVTVTLAAFCSFSESNFKVENKNLAEIPPVIVNIPPTHLAVTD